jgi:hypothetical protein
MYLVECFTDENLLRGLGVSGASIRRMRGKGKVLPFIMQHVEQPYTALMDRDRMEAQPKDLSLFKLEKLGEGVERYTWRHHTLVMVDDNVEEWLVRAARLAGVSLAEFKLPTTAEALHRIEPKVGDPRMLDLVRRLEEKRSPALAVLRAALGR